MELNSKTKYKKIFIILIFSMIIIIFSSCDLNVNNPHIKFQEYNYEFSNKNINSFLDIISFYKTQDNGYSFWNEEIRTPDMYGTYYSVKLLKEIDYNFKIPNINVYNLNEVISSSSSLFDLALYCDLFKDNIQKDDSLKQKIYNYVIMLKMDNGLFKMNQDNEETDTFSNLCAVKILNCCKENYDYSKIKVWIVKYLKNNLKNEKNDLNMYYSDLINIFQTLKLMSFKSNKINYYASQYFNNYQSYINNLLSEKQLDLFTFYVYFQTIKDFNLKSNISKEEIENYINSLKNKCGGYGYTEGSQTDLQVTYYVSNICDYYGINFNSNSKNLINLIMRHQLVTTNWFIETSIYESSIDSTYYAFSILNDLEINCTEEIKEYINNRPENEEEIYTYVLKSYIGAELNMDSINSTINNTVLTLTQNFNKNNIKALYLLTNIPEVRQNISSENIKSIKEVSKKYFNKTDIEYTTKFYLISLYNLEGVDKNSVKLLSDTLKALIKEYPCSIETLYGAIIALESSNDSKLNLTEQLSNNEFLNWCEYVLSKTDHGNCIYCYKGGKDKFADFKSIYYGVYSVNRIKHYLK